MCDLKLEEWMRNWRKRSRNIIERRLRTLISHSLLGYLYSNHTAHHAKLKSYPNLASFDTIIIYCLKSQVEVIYANNSTLVWLRSILWALMSMDLIGY
ncbi:hypothetical protein HN51_042840 [Arachis hypogaea]